MKRIYIFLLTYQRGFHLDNPCNNISDGCVHVLFNGRHVTVSGTIQQTKVKRTSLCKRSIDAYSGWN